MKFSNLLFSLICLSTLLSCQDDDISADQPPQLKAVDLTSLTIGQESKFVLLSGVCGWAEQYEYSGDTLVLRVIEENNRMLFEESFTAGSPLHADNPIPVTYSVTKGENQIIIPDRERSTLFFFYGSDIIHTAPTHEINLVQEGCDQMHDGIPFTGDQIAFIPDLAIHDIALDNQTVVSCVPILIDLKAFLVYKDGDLNLSYTLDSGFPGLTFRGWKLIE